MEKEYWVAVDREGHFALFEGDGPRDAFRCDDTFVPLNLMTGPDDAGAFDVYASEMHLAIGDRDRINYVAVLSLSEDALASSLPRGISLRTRGGAGAFFMTIRAEVLRAFHERGECARCWVDESMVIREGRLASESGAFVYRWVGDAWERFEVPEPAPHIAHFTHLEREEDALAIVRTRFDGSFREARRITSGFTISERADSIECVVCDSPRKKASDPFDRMHADKLAKIWRAAWKGR